MQVLTQETRGSAVSAVGHVVFAGGGTGGHLFPGLAVAEQLRRMAPETRITFAGTGSGFERLHVDTAGFEYRAIPSRPGPHSAWEAVRFVADHFVGFHAAHALIRREGVSAVVGLGGYASLAVGRAAAARGVPLVLLEQNAVPGRTTRWLTPSASLICASFPQIRDQLNATCPLRITGNPIRDGIALLRDANGSVAPTRFAGRRRLLVLGGSQGAHALNTAVPRALYKVRHLLGGLRIVHQTGEADAGATRSLYSKLALEAQVIPFISDMPRALAGTHLAVSRSGGTALAELAAAGVPAVLVPYPHAIDDHQRKNAEAVAAAGSSLVVEHPQSGRRLDYRLADILAELLVDQPRLVKMSHDARRMSRPDAAWQVASMIQDLVPARPHRRAG